MSSDRRIERVWQRMEDLQGQLRSAILAETTQEMESPAGVAHAESIDLEDQLESLPEELRNHDNGRSVSLQTALVCVEHAIVSAQKIALATNVTEMRAYLLEFATHVNFADAYLQAALGTRKGQTESRPNPDEQIRKYSPMG
jgi:hypothetical protein